MEREHQKKSEVEKLQDEIERLKEAEGALRFLLRDPDTLFRVAVYLKVGDYLDKRRASREKWRISEENVWRG